MLHMLPLVVAATFGQSDLTDRNFDNLLRQIVPTKAELAYRDIAWRPNLWDAVREAHDKRLPILMYAMNGHPLACV